MRGRSRARLSARRSAGLTQGEAGLFSLNTPVSSDFERFAWIFARSERKACAASGTTSKTTSTRPSPLATERIASALSIALS